MAKLIQFYVPQNFKPPKRQLAAPGTAGQDHRVRKCFDQEVCLVARKMMCRSQLLNLRIADARVALHKGAVLWTLVRVYSSQ
jgi:hypothetical protein